MVARWQSFLRAHPRIADTLIALALVTACFPGAVLAVDGIPTPTRWPYWLVAGAACAAMAWHRDHLHIAAPVTIAGTTAVVVLGFVPTPLVLTPAMTALFLVALRTGPRTTYLVTAATIAIITGATLLTGPDGESFDLKVFGPSLWLLLPAALGSALRLRLAYTDAVRARAEYAERTREEEARHRVAEERMRIARELHDVAAHHLALANAQAGTIAHLVTTEPGQARTMAEDLGGTISSALRELKATVGLLRQSGDPEAPLEPAPGLAQLPELAASFGTAGLTVTITTDGAPRPLSPGVDLTAYRIIQEALTNVAKHASAARAEVRLAYADDRLGITVTNDCGPRAPAAPATGSGHGLIGMRERVLSLGGWLRVGQRPAGGFEVVTELPLHPDEDQAS